MAIIGLIITGIELLLRTIPVGTDLYFKIQEERVRWKAFEIAANDERNEEWASVRAEAKEYLDRLMK